MSCGHGELLLLPKTEKLRQTCYFPCLNTSNSVFSGCIGGNSCCQKIMKTFYCSVKILWKMFCYFVDIECKNVLQVWSKLLIEKCLAF